MGRLLLLFLAFGAGLTVEYTYRAQENAVDLSTPCTALKYGFANLTVNWDNWGGDQGTVTGVITGFVNETTTGQKWVLNMTGSWQTATSVQKSSVSFDWSAQGPVGGLEWEYRYVGVSIGPWLEYSSPQQQQNTLVGSVVRLVGHGKAPAGEAASFYAVQK